MKITKKMNGYTLRMSDNEMYLLELMVEMAEVNQREVWDRSSTHMRKAYSRRCGPKGYGKPFLRVDQDNRKW